MACRLAAGSVWLFGADRPDREQYYVENGHDQLTPARGCSCCRFAKKIWMPLEGQGCLRGSIRLPRG
jgi:hypothetical protein